MQITIGELELTSEYRGCDHLDCTIIIKVSKDVACRTDESIKVGALELIEAIKALNATCWRP